MKENGVRCACMEWLGKVSSMTNRLLRPNYISYGDNLIYRLTENRNRSCYGFPSINLDLLMVSCSLPYPDG